MRIFPLLTNYNLNMCVMPAIYGIQHSFNIFDETIAVKIITGSAENIVVRYLLWPFEVSQIDASCKMYKFYLLFASLTIRSFYRFSINKVSLAESRTTALRS